MPAFARAPTGSVPLWRVTHSGLAVPLTGLFQIRDIAVVDVVVCDDRVLFLLSSLQIFFVREKDTKINTP
jgi:hypothetical protein